jgi:hypothetical protein
MKRLLEKSAGCFMSMYLGGILFLCAVYIIEVKFNIPASRYLINNYGFEVNNCQNLNIQSSKMGVLRISELEFTRGTSRCLIKHLVGIDKLMVKMSPGGYMLEARDLGAYLRDNDIGLHIEYLCVSSCVEFMAIAPKSTICKSASVGNHQGGFDFGAFTTVGNMIAYPFSFILNKIDEEYQVRAGIDISDIRLRAGGRDLSWIPNDKLVEYGYVDRVVLCDYDSQ